jgi:deoxyribose-phosphate aldolase
MDTSRSLQSLAKMIDHSLLHPTMTDADILAGCQVARRYQVATVCVKPYAVGMAKAALEGSDVGICAVVGFPHGNSTTQIKVAETRRAIRDGAGEIDMVINIGKALGGNWAYVRAEIKAVNRACRASGALLKVIFETDYLGDEHIIMLCRICSQVGVSFVKTSTGYGFVKQPNGDYNYRGATDHNLRLMRQHCTPEVQVKAAGGVRNLDALLEVRALGATRCGATATEAMLEEARQRGYE